MRCESLAQIGRLSLLRRIAEFTERENMTITMRAIDWEIVLGLLNLLNRGTVNKVQYMDVLEALCMST